VAASGDARLISDDRLRALLGRGPRTSRPHEELNELEIAVAEYIHGAQPPR
jgi:hypothetical protein